VISLAQALHTRHGEQHPSEVHRAGGLKAVPAPRLNTKESPNAPELAVTTTSAGTSYMRSVDPDALRCLVSAHESPPPPVSTPLEVEAVRERADRG
jgi:hypothetical protein